MVIAEGECNYYYNRKNIDCTLAVQKNITTVNHNSSLYEFSYMTGFEPIGNKTKLSKIYKNSSSVPNIVLYSSILKKVQCNWYNFIIFPMWLKVLNYFSVFLLVYILI